MLFIALLCGTYGNFTPNEHATEGIVKWHAIAVLEGVSTAGGGGEITSCIIRKAIALVGTCR